jgi:hypothetical protein
MAAHRTALVVASTLALLAYACTAVSGTQSLRATRPAVAKNNFLFNNHTGEMYSEPSLFGLPNYQAELVGMIKTDVVGNEQGCNPYNGSFNPYTEGPQTNMIALVKRGGCSFGTKALMAQQAQASAIIVYNDRPNVRPLPKMAGGDDTPSINIPGMLITNEDGVFLAAGVAKWITANTEPKIPTDPYYGGLWVSLAYSLIAPDDRVEFDLFTYPDEANAQQFVTEFADVIAQLGKAAYFTPHYRIVDGSTHGCLSTDGTCSEDSLMCGSQCTNCGRYCRLDPNNDLDTRPDGEDQVRESALAKCVFLHGDKTNQPQLWWQYVNERTNTLECVKVQPYDPDCSDRAMKVVGLSDADIASIKACTGNTAYDNDATNPLLESELDWYNDWQPLTSPYLFVNNFTYFGSFGCPAPAGPSTCGPLSMICQGYAVNTAPALCGFVGNGCDAGVMRDSCGVCGGTAKEGESCEHSESKSFPVGVSATHAHTCMQPARGAASCDSAYSISCVVLCCVRVVQPVIGVAIVCCLLIGGVVYWYMRRQNVRMRDDIDSLLKQYLPLDGTQGAGASSNGKHAASPGSGRDQLRLIGNLDTSDEPTDL